MRGVEVGLRKSGENEIRAAEKGDAEATRIFHQEIELRKLRWGVECPLGRLGGDCVPAASIARPLNDEIRLQTLATHHVHAFICESVFTAGA